MGDRYVLGFAPAPGFPQSQILCKIYKGPSDETSPSCVYICTHAKRSLSEFGGLWKHQNNPACTENVRGLLGHVVTSVLTWPASTTVHNKKKTNINYAPCWTVKLYNAHIWQASLQSLFFQIESCTIFCIPVSVCLTYSPFFLLFWCRSTIVCVSLAISKCIASNRQIFYRK